MTGNKNHISIITLNVKGFNSPIKRHRLAMWIKKHNPNVCCLQETHLTAKAIQRLKMKGWKRRYHSKGDQKQAGVATLISNKIDFKLKHIKRDKERHFLLIKGTI